MYVLFQGNKYKDKELTPLDMFKECHYSQKKGFSPLVHEAIVSQLSKSLSNLYLAIHMLTLILHWKTRMTWNHSLLNLWQMEDARMRPVLYLMSSRRTQPNLAFFRMLVSSISPLDPKRACMLQNWRKSRGKMHNCRRLSKDRQIEWMPCKQSLTVSAR